MPGQMIKVADGAATYPYSFEQLQADNPNVSFPRDPQSEDLEPFGVWIVEDPGLPGFDAETQSLVERMPVLVEGRYVRQLEVVPLDAAALAARLEERRNATFCSRFQGRAALLLEGRLEEADQKVAECGDPMVQLGWAEAGEWRRMSPGLLKIAVLLELDDADLDRLFAIARTIEV